MDIVFLFYGLAFLVMGLVIVILRSDESHLELSDILWLLAAFGFTHGILEWTDLWQIVRGDNTALAAAQPAILLVSYLFLFEFARRLMLISLPAEVKAKPVCRLLGAWVYVPLLGGIAGCGVVSDQPSLSMIIASRNLAGFLGSVLAGVGILLYWRYRLEPTALNLRVIRISSHVACGAFIAYAILAGLVVPRADWFPASVINQEAFLELFHIPVQVLRAICAVLVAASVGTLLRIFRMEELQRLQSALQETRWAIAEQHRLSALNEQILCAAAEGVLGTDIECKIVFVNDAALGMLGCQREELLGKSILPLIHRAEATGDAYSMDDFPINLSMHDNSVHRVSEDVLLRKDGSSFPVEYVAAPLHGDGEAVTGDVVTFQDITERKQAEASLHELNASLEQRMNEQMQLNIEKEHLLIQQSRNAAMGEMISNIAHQWRQPLSTLGVVVQNILLDYKENQLNQNELEKYVETAQKCVMRMSETIDDFRNFFRPDKAKTDFSLHQAVSDSMELLEATMKNHGIQITLSADRNLQTFGHINEFSQVILNLLSNAKDALLANRTHQRKIEVELSSSDCFGLVVIRDNAGGVPEKAIDRIFDPYFTTKAGGTGIGLYMSKTIVQKHMGGNIICRNTADGAEFTVSIPLVANDKTVLEQRLQESL